MFPGQTLRDVLARLFGSCVTISTSPKAAGSCLDVLANLLGEQNPTTVKFALESMAILLDAAQTRAVGEVFKRVMNTLLAMREAEECIYVDAIDKV